MRKKKAKLSALFEVLSGCTKADVCNRRLIFHYGPLQQLASDSDFAAITAADISKGTRDHKFLIIIVQVRASPCPLIPSDQKVLLHFRGSEDFASGNSLRKGSNVLRSRLRGGAVPGP